MTLLEFINDLDKSDSTIKNYFANYKMLRASLIELNNVIGMEKIKEQVSREIKKHVINKKRNIAHDKDRKHYMLSGPPGCGKTTVGKILCKIWVGIGLVGKSGDSVPKKVATFNRVQDELIRHQRQHIKEYKDKIRVATSALNSSNHASSLCKKSINNLIRLKDGKSNPIVDELITDISNANKVLEESRKVIPSLSKIKVSSLQGFGMDTDGSNISSKEDSELPFYVYNRNDLISRYVGDSTHRTTAALMEALDGVAYFDEAYNICNNTNGMGDPYGKEALTAINQFMDEHSDKLIVVFAGYRDEIERNLFTAQPGLKSRFLNKYEIDKYTPDELTKIYVQRLRFSDWYINETAELRKIIKDNYEYFEYQGRDMDTLAIYTKLIISDKIYEDTVEGREINKHITDFDIVRRAIEMFKDNHMKTNNTRSMNDLQRLAEMLGT